MPDSPVVNDCQSDVWSFERLRSNHKIKRKRRARRFTSNGSLAADILGACQAQPDLLVLALFAGVAHVTQVFGNASLQIDNLLPVLSGQFYRLSLGTEFDFAN